MLYCRSVQEYCRQYHRSRIEFFFFSTAVCLSLVYVSSWKEWACSSWHLVLVWYCMAAFICTNEIKWYNFFLLFIEKQLWIRRTTVSVKVSDWSEKKIRLKSQLWVRKTVDIVCTNSVVRVNIFWLIKKKKGPT